MGKKWLTLSEAAERLGVHPATLRHWADAGKIPSFRTPGGHRRFSAEVIDAFLNAQSTGQLPALISTQPIVERALEVTRSRLPQARQGAPWYERFDEETRRRKRQQGQQLFALAMQYVAKPEERPHILERARALGQVYGVDSFRFGISLVDTLKAITFFRQALIDTLEANGSLAAGQSAANFRIAQEVDRFTQEVMYATAEGFEHALRQALERSDNHQEE